MVNLIDLYPDTLCIRLTKKEYLRILKLSKKMNISTRAVLISLINRRYKYMFGSYRL